MKILRVLSRPNLGGPTRQAVALARAALELGVDEILVVGQVQDREAAIHVGGLLPDDRLRVVPELGRSVAPWRDHRALAALRRLFAEERPQVVHTHTSKAGALGRIAARRAGVPCIAHTFHGHVLRDHLPWWGARLATRVERRLARRSDLLFAVSPTCVRELCEFGVTMEARLIAPAVPRPARPAAERLAALRVDLDLPPAGRLAAFVGRLVPVKRPELALAVARARPDWTVAVAGDGPLRRLVMADDVPSNLRWLGALDDVTGLLAASDALLLTSRREGFPLAGVEAALLGTAVVGFEVPGVADLLAALATGPGVPPAAGVEGLAAALEQPREPGVPQRDALARRCDPRAVAGQLHDAYRQVLGGSGRPPGYPGAA